MGAWIETGQILGESIANAVAPYVGAWIETEQTKLLANDSKSHPTWVRGLKHNQDYLRHSRNIVAPYVGAWIETS